jgi:O-antigen/teichoic acid export membrane protein
MIHWLTRFKLLSNIQARFALLDEHMQQVLRGGAAAFVLRVLGAAFNFGFNIVMARLLGAEGAGVYYLAYSATLLATVLGRLGLDNAMLRFSAANASQGNWSKVAGVYRRGMLISLGASAMVTLVIVLNATWIASGIFKELALVAPLRLMALSITPWSLLTLHAEMLKSLEKIVAATVAQAAGVPLIALLIFVVVGNSWGTMGAVAAYVTATTIVLFTSILLWRQATPQLRDLPGNFDTSLLVATSLPLFWVMLTDLTMNIADTFFLGFWATSEAVGIYGVAKRTAVLTVFILIAVNSIVAPKFAALYAAGDHDALGAVARRSAALVTVLATPALLLFILLPGKVLLIFGPEFVEGAAALTILAIGQFVNAATGSVGYLLIMTGHEKLVRNNVVGSAALNIMLMVILVPPCGIVGAAIATAVNLAVMNLVSTFLVYRKLGIMTLPIPGFIRRGIEL